MTNIHQLALDAVRQSATLVEAQSKVCERVYWLILQDQEKGLVGLDIAKRFDEALQATQNSWNSTHPVGWPSYPQRHETLQEWNMEIMAEHIPADKEEG